MRRVLFDKSFQSAVGVVEPFGDDSHVGDNRHEVSIALPARDDVNMQVIIDASAGRLADVHPDVKPLRAHSLAGELGEICHLMHQLGLHLR